jgi:hypothetical protein
MLSTTEIHELAMEQLEGQKREAWLDLQEAYKGSKLTGDYQSERITGLLGKASELEGQIIELRGQMIGTGIWTQDGGGFIGGWHQGEQLGEDLLYERYELGLRIGHGFIDSISRKITQTG